MGTAIQVTIAGAGALGLSCALALADVGCAVTVCDPTQPGDNASGVAAGMLAPVFEAILDAEATPHFELLLAARDLWPALADRADVQLDRRGALGAGQEPWLGKVAAGMQRLGLAAPHLPPSAAQALAPGLSAGLGGILSPEDWRLDAPLALAALRAAAGAAGVSFRRETVQAPARDGVLVVATGAGDRGLAPELAHLHPIKGHILRIAGAADGLTVRGDGIYAVPGDGGLAVGATMEVGVSDPTVDPARGAPLLAAGAQLFPTLADAAFRLQAGVRAATADGLPLVGRSRRPGVLLAVGARRNGWLLAPLVAREIVACVTEGEAGPYAARLDPRRFEGAA